MIANGLYEICLNRFREIKNGYICCKAYPDGVPLTCFCAQHCDLEYMDEGRQLPVLNCPKGYHLEIRDGYFDDLREYSKHYF